MVETNWEPSKNKLNKSNILICLIIFLHPYIYIYIYIYDDNDDYHIFTDDSCKVFISEVMDTC